VENVAALLDHTHLVAHLELLPADRALFILLHQPRKVRRVLIQKVFHELHPLLELFLSFFLPLFLELSFLHLLLFLLLGFPFLQLGLFEVFLREGVAP